MPDRSPLHRSALVLGTIALAALCAAGSPAAAASPPRTLRVDDLYLTPGRSARSKAPTTRRRATSARRSFFRPFLGVSLSFVAVRHTLAGVAASIMATTPLLIIPLVVVLRRERVGLAGVGGAVLVVLGVALLFV